MYTSQVCIWLADLVSAHLFHLLFTYLSFDTAQYSISKHLFKSISDDAFHHIFIARSV